MKTQTLKRIAAVIYGIPFIIFGIFHLMNASKMVAYMPGWMPLKEFFIIIAGLGMIAAGISFITNKQVKLAGMLLALLLLIFTLAIHLPQLGNAQMAQMATQAILKNIGLIGGALLIAGTANKKIN